VVVAAIPIGNLVNNAGQKTPATHALQDSASLDQAHLGAGRERNDADTIVRVVGARNLCRATASHHEDQIEIQVDGPEDLF